MNALIASNHPMTMSSIEIAELTGKRHPDVMRDIRTQLGKLLGLGLSKFAHTQVNEQNGQPYPVYLLPKRETLILVSGYSVELRARIIDRWQELEAREQPAPPVNLSDARSLRAALLGYTEKAAPSQIGGPSSPGRGKTPSTHPPQPLINKTPCHKQPRSPMARTRPPSPFPTAPHRPTSCQPSINPRPR